MASLQKATVAFGACLPRFMARWAYTIPFFIYKKLTQKEGVSVWYRNSLAFDDFVFGYSDIDFTLFSEGNLDFD